MFYFLYFFLFYVILVDIIQGVGGGWPGNLCCFPPVLFFILIGKITSLEKENSSMCIKNAD